MSGVRLPRRRGRLWLAVAALTGLAPSAAGAQPSTSKEAVRVGDSVVRLALARHHGYPALRWTDLPASLVSDPVGRGSVGKARSGDVYLSVIAGSPFARHGDAVFQLANPPYLEHGDLWVPVELVEALPRLEAAAPPPAAPSSPSRSPRAAGPGAGSSEDGATALPARRTGPWRVVIDAGHGGHDPGARSPRSGAREKDITLRVARALRDELRRRGGIQPLMIRDDDTFVEVMQRPAMAMKVNADLFISIHVNAEPRRRSRASGFETYYLGRARTEESRRVALRENAVIQLGEDGEQPTAEEVEFILAGLDRDVNLGESRRFAGYVQNGLRGVLNSEDRGVKGGPFYVLLTTSDTPTVLVELGFITNPSDEKQLTSRKVQRRVAGALADSIETYLEETGRRMVVMEGRG